MEWSLVGGAGNVRHPGQLGCVFAGSGVKSELLPFDLEGLMAPRFSWSRWLSLSRLVYGYICEIERTPVYGYL